MSTKSSSNRLHEDFGKSEDRRNKKRDDPNALTTNELIKQITQSIYERLDRLEDKREEEHKKEIKQFEE